MFLKMSNESHLYEKKEEKQPTYVVAATASAAMLFTL